MIPFYLERSNNIMTQLWIIILLIFEEVSKGISHQTTTFEDFLNHLHSYFLDRVVSEEDLPIAVAEAFPLFPGIDYIL